MRLDGVGIGTYCTANPHSGGVPAAIGWNGSGSIAARDLVSTVNCAPPRKGGFFLFRDLAGGGTGFNLSNALDVQFVP